MGLGGNATIGWFSTSRGLFMNHPTLAQNTPPTIGSQHLLSSLRNR